MWTLDNSSHPPLLTTLDEFCQVNLLLNCTEFATTKLHVVTSSLELAHHQSHVRGWEGRPQKSYSRVGMKATRVVFDSGR